MSSLERGEAMRNRLEGSGHPIASALLVVRRWVPLVLLPTLCGLACAARQPIARAPQAVQSFVGDVGEDEWQRAVPAKGSEIALPRLIRGRKQPDDRGVLAIGETATATVAQVIRADGKVGLYRIVASTNPRLRRG